MEDSTQQPDYEIVVDDGTHDEEPKSAEESLPPLADEQPTCMDWILKSFPPESFKEDGAHGRYVIGYYPPIPDLMVPLLGVYGGPAALSMINFGLVPMLMFNDPVLATIFRKPADVVTTSGGLISAYLSIIAYYSALSSAPSDDDAEHYLGTNTFPEESSASVRETTSYLSHSYVSKRSFTGDEHMRFGTPKSLKPDDLGAILVAASKENKRADGSVPATVAARFLLAKVMGFARSRGRTDSAWFSDRTLRRTKKMEIEIDPNDKLGDQTAPKNSEPCAAQGAIRVMGSYRRSPQWFRDFFRRRSWFYPPYLPAWFSDAWLFRVVGRIVMYENFGIVSAFAQACAKDGRAVLNILLQDDLTGDGVVEKLAEAYELAHAKTLEYVNILRRTVVEMTSISRGKNAEVWDCEMVGVPPFIETDGQTAPCVIGDAPVSIVDGKRVYEEDNAFHISQKTHDLFVAEAKHNAGAALEMATRLAPLAGIPVEKITAAVEFLDRVVGDVSGPELMVSAFPRDVLVGMLSVGVQAAFANTRMRLYELGAKAEVEEMFVIEADAMRVAKESGRLLMLGHYTTAFPALKTK